MNKTIKDIRVLQIGMHDKIGGIETCLMNYYRELHKKNIQFDFITTFDTICFEEEINRLGGKVYKICSEKKNPFKYYNQLKEIIKNNKYNIVHINMLSAANILPIIVSKKQRVPHIILHSHNTNTTNSIVKKIMNFVNKPFLRFGTDFFACSKEAGKWLFGDSILKKKELIIVNNAIDVEKFKFDIKKRMEIRKKLQIENNFVIGHVGRFTYQKNHKFIINVFFEFQKKHKDAVLMLIGEGELEKSIKELVEKYKISDKVIFCGTTDYVEDYLQAMDVFVFPSRFEGLSLVSIEAQMCGLKVVGSDNLSRESKITNNITYISLKDDISNWIKEMENNIKADERSKEIKLLNNEYNIEIEANKLAKLYREKVL